MSHDICHLVEWALIVFNSKSYGCLLKQMNDFH